MIFHALDVFSIIFATVYVEVKIGARMGAILSASAMYMQACQISGFRPEIIGFFIALPALRLSRENLRQNH